MWGGDELKNQEEVVIAILYINAREAGKGQLRESVMRQG